MTALVKKDFYLMGKQMWLLMAVAVIFSLIPQFASFGSAYLMVLGLSLPMTTLAYDERCHWDTYLAMTPCRPVTVVLSKYLFTFITTAGSMTLTLLLDLARTTVTHADYDLAEGVLERVSLLTVIQLINAITLPTIFRFGVEKGRLTMTALAFGTFAVIVGGAKLIGGDRMFGWADQIPLHILGVIAAVIIVVANMGSLFLAVRIYRKRQAGAYT